MARITIARAAFESLSDATWSELRTSAGVTLGVPFPTENPDVLAWDDPRINVAAVLAKATELGVTVTDETPARPDGMPEPGPYVPPDIFIPPPAPEPVDPVAVLATLVTPLVDATTMADVQEAAAAAQEAMS